VPHRHTWGFSLSELKLRVCETWLDLGLIPLNFEASSWDRGESPLAWTQVASSYCLKKHGLSAGRYKLIEPKLQNLRLPCTSPDRRFDGLFDESDLSVCERSSLL